MWKQRLVRTRSKSPSKVKKSALGSSSSRSRSSSREVNKSKPVDTVRTVPIEDENSSHYSPTPTNETDIQDEREPRQQVDRKSITFSSVEVRTYNRILGDNPACSGGPPTQLDWEYEVSTNISLDEYEKVRPPLRPKLDLHLTPFMRRYSMHNDFGFSHQEINAACVGIQKIRSQRAHTKAMNLEGKNRKWSLRRVWRWLKGVFLRKKANSGLGIGSKIVVETWGEEV